MPLLLQDTSGLAKFNRSEFCVFCFNLILLLGSLKTVGNNDNLWDMFSWKTKVPFMLVILSYLLFIVLLITILMLWPVVQKV